MKKENSSLEEKEFRLYPDDNPRDSLRWYAVYTRPRHEKKVLSNLQKKGIESYLPLIKQYHQWSDRKKWVEEPLIRGYVFVNIPLKYSLYVLETYGIVRFVMFKREYASIPNFQIEALKRTIDSKYPIEARPYLKVGQIVEVVEGSLKGIIGRIQRIENDNKFVISLDAIQSAFSVQIDPSLLRLASEKKRKKILTLPLGL